MEHLCSAISRKLGLSKTTNNKYVQLENFQKFQLKVKVIAKLSHHLLVTIDKFMIIFQVY